MWIYKQKLIYFLIVFFFTACNKQYKGNVIYHLNDKTYIDSIMKVELDTSRYLGKTPMKSNISLYELYSRPIDETGFGHWGTVPLVAFYKLGKTWYRKTATHPSKSPQLGRLARARGLQQIIIFL